MNANSAADRRPTEWAFVMVPARTRLMFVHPVPRLDQTSWCEGGTRTDRTRLTEFDIAS